MNSAKWTWPKEHAKVNVVWRSAKGGIVNAVLPRSNGLVLAFIKPLTALPSELLFLTNPDKVLYKIRSSFLPRPIGWPLITKSIDEGKTEITTRLQKFYDFVLIEGFKKNTPSAADWKLPIDHHPPHWVSRVNKEQLQYLLWA